jgi:hypothetical protein
MAQEPITLQWRQSPKKGVPMNRAAEGVLAAKWRIIDSGLLPGIAPGSYGSGVLRAVTPDNPNRSLHP